MNIIFRMPDFFVWFSVPWFAIKSFDLLQKLLSVHFGRSVEDLGLPLNILAYVGCFLITIFMVWLGYSIISAFRYKDPGVDSTLYFYHEDYSPDCDSNDNSDCGGDGGSDSD